MLKAVFSKQIPRVSAASWAKVGGLLLFAPLYYIAVIRLLADLITSFQDSQRQVFPLWFKFYFYEHAALIPDQSPAPKVCCGLTPHSQGSPGLWLSSPEGGLRGTPPGLLQGSEDSFPKVAETWDAVRSGWGRGRPLAALGAFDTRVLGGLRCLS